MIKNYKNENAAEISFLSLLSLEIQPPSDTPLSLNLDGINAMSLCAAKTASDRQKVIEATRHGKVWLLITTDVASRGLDLPALTTVINYDCPNSVTDYVHRVGRCGRYNRKGKVSKFKTYTYYTVYTIYVYKF